MGTNSHYAVFGHPIGHSKSPLIHRLFAEQTQQNGFTYLAQDVTPEAFQSAVDDFFCTGGEGLNCTVPLKQLAWQLANKRSQRAEISKAVNTLSLLKDNTVFGDNTDGIGLIQDLSTNLKIGLKGSDILLMGAGGASRGILGPLLDQKPKKLAVANRTMEKAVILVKQFENLGPVAYSSFEALHGHSFDLILNATAASLQNQLPPLPTHILKNPGYCYDLAYGDEPTTFVRWGKQQNATISTDGLGMLVEQAAEAFLIWRGIKPDTRPVIDFLNSKRASTA